MKSSDMFYAPLGYERRTIRDAVTFSGRNRKERTAPGTAESPPDSVSFQTSPEGGNPPRQQGKWRVKTQRLLQKLHLSKKSPPEKTGTGESTPDRDETGTPAKKRWRLPGLSGRKKAAAEKPEDVSRGTRLKRIARKTVENGGQTIAWTGILMTTGIMLPGRPKDVIPVVVHLNANLLSLLLPEPMVAKLYEKSLAKSNKPAAKDPVQDQPPPKENMVAVFAKSKTVQRAVGRAREIGEKPWFKNNITPIGHRLENLAVTRWSVRKAKGLKTWIIDHGPGQRIAYAVTRPFIKPSIALERFHQEHKASDETVVTGKYATVSVRKRDNRLKQMVKDMAAAYRGESVPFRPSGEDVMSVQLNLPPGTATKKELETRIAEDVQQSLHTAVEQRNRERETFRKGEKSAKRKKWLTRALTVPAIWGAVNLAWFEGPRVAWTEFHAGYETIGEIRKTYELFGQPTGIPELHPKAYIVAPTDSKCLVEVVDAWTKMRWWCVVSGATMKELHRLPKVPIFHTPVSFLDQPISGGFPSGRVVPSVENTAVLEVHPENEFWDPTEEDPYDFWVERFHETVVRQLPIARIVIKRPDEISNPELRDLVNSFYTTTPNGVQMTGEGMSIVSAIAGLALDRSYESIETNTDDQ